MNTNSNPEESESKRPESADKNRPFATVIKGLALFAFICLAIDIVYPSVGSGGPARLTGAKSEEASISGALEMYYVDNGSFPVGKDGLKDLIAQPQGGTNWHGPYLDKIPLDPWGNPYIYTCPGVHNRGRFDLMSMGADGRIGGDDDIANWDTSVK